MAGRRATHITASGHCLPGLYAAMCGDGKHPLVVDTGDLVRVKRDFPGMFEITFLVNVFRPFELGERADAAHSVRISADE